MVGRSRRSNRQGIDHAYDEDEDGSNSSSYYYGEGGELDDHEDGGGGGEGEGSYRSAGSSSSRNTNGNASARSDSESGSSSHHQLVMLPRTRIIVSSVILLAAIAIGTATYVVTSQGQNQTFTSSYYDYCDLVLQSTRAEAGRLMGSVQSFALSITTYTLATGADWPYVTVPDFELRGFKSNQVSKSLSITFSPLVTSKNMDSWEAYANSSQDWYNKGRAVHSLLSLTSSSAAVVSPDGQAPIRRGLAEQGANQDATPMVHFMASTASGPASTIPGHVWTFTDRGEPRAVDAGSNVPYAPLWQQAPAPSNPSLVNYDLLSDPRLLAVYDIVRVARRPVLSSVMDLRFLYSGARSIVPSEAKSAQATPSTVAEAQNVTSLIMSPLYPFVATKENLPGRDEITGLLLNVIDWQRYLVNILPTNVNGLIVVLTSTCGDVFTFQLNGPTVEYLGVGDLHEQSYDSFLVTSEPFGNDWLTKWNATPGANLDGGACSYVLELYPSTTMQSVYTDDKPAIYTSVVVLLFAFTAMVFLLYDWLVTRRQNKVNATAKKTNAILSSLFPSTVRDRILQEAEEQAEQEEQLKQQSQQNTKRGGFALGTKALLRDFLDDVEEGVAAEKSGSGVAGSSKLAVSRPIADLFPETTVCFADLVGFTAWSSVREPTHVFQLLETIYHAFDKVAKKRNVFKVETVGDCYVAVTGLPEPRKDHAVLLCRFAYECLQVMNDLTKKLEVTLGPDTGDLSIRIGLHSGPVTAGVLRGERSRFQLFGDTVNTAAFIESTGERNRIHVSQETSDLLATAGKGHWVEERNEKIHIKGKDELQTYWLISRGSPSGQSRSSGSAADSTEDAMEENDHYGSPSNLLHPFDSKTQRLVEWNTDVLSRLLKDVVASRLSRESYRVEGLPNDTVHGIARQESTNVLDEVVEIIHLPDFDVQGVNRRVDASNMELSDKVKQQLRDYITIIASMYRDNPFHNFEHASHVTMSVVKLLSRIVAPNLTTSDIDADSNIASTLHDHTFGLTSDSLTQFAVVLSALIHDVDHLGVPNAQLVKENAFIARAYKGKSVAEQNSVDVAWNLLMDVSFRELRMAIYSNADEQKRFRQLVVNTVMATDIMDKDLKALRNARWDKAFKESSSSESQKDIIDRKATIVIEHLIQASDVAHTMQHWHIYVKWNSRLFEEMYRAYKAGRAEKDPSEFWYKGEIGFFDFYIIPLAKKLKDCGVFGVSSDEYLNYAENNRKEWEAKGHEVVAKMVEKYRNEDCDGSPPQDASPKLDVASKNSVTIVERSEHSGSRERSRDDEPQPTMVKASTETAVSHDSQPQPCVSPIVEVSSSSDANVAGESISTASLSRGAIEMSEKRFQKQLARVQRCSEVDTKVEEMTFI